MFDKQVFLQNLRLNGLQNSMTILHHYLFVHCLPMTYVDEMFAATFIDLE